MSQKPYQRPADDVAHELDSWPAKGLSSHLVSKRQQQYGPNSLESESSVHPVRLFFSQFKDVLIIILIIAATISLALSYLGEHGEGPIEALLIYGIVLAIAFVGFLNEYKAEKTVEALKKLVTQTTKVRRGGQVVEVEADQLVPGDIVLLEEGQKVTADLRIVESHSLRIDEASLTGESQPVSKRTDAIDGEQALGDQTNMAFSGTFIASGSGEGVVVGIGNDTELGKIARMVSDVESEQTPMQKKLDKLGKQIGYGVIGVCVVVFAAIFFFGQESADAELITRVVFAFTAAVALAVAAIPEGLAFVVRISLALGARRMAGKNALVRKLSAVEALGSTDVVCSDKTGTLTRGEMTVRALFTNGQQYSVSGSGYDSEGQFSLDGKQLESLEEVEPLLRVGLLCNNSEIRDQHVLGDPTEGALVVSAEKAGLKRAQEQQNAKRIDELPFSSDRKRMSTIHKVSAGYLVAVKGAPEIILERCEYVLLGGKKQKLTDKHREEIKTANTELAGQALRVLGFALKQVRVKPSEDDAEQKLTFVGLQGMMDPPREEVVEVIHRVTTEAGMRVLMITGDHAATASAVAEEIGIRGETITGVELDQMGQAEFERRVEEISVYARVNPEHKIRIVQALKSHGHQVAMTGDGVNDAPAIKAADIGIAMGITGTDAAKEASDMILLDDQFLTIINAIEEGRGIFDNMRKFVNYLLSANIAEVIAVFVGVLIFQDLLLTAAQLLFINIVTDGLPAVALGSDPAEKGIMRFRPARFQAAIIDKRVWTEMLIFGALMSIALLVHFGYIFDGSAESDVLAKSVAFAGMVVYEMVRLIDIRTDYHIRWFTNPWLSVAMLGSFALLGIVMYVPSIAEIFDLTQIPLRDWLIIVAVSVLLFVSMKLVNPVLNRLMPDVPRS